MGYSFCLKSLLLRLFFGIPGGILADRECSTLPPVLSPADVLISWEFPRLCRGGSRSLTFSGVVSSASGDQPARWWMGGILRRSILRELSAGTVVLNFIDCDSPSFNGATLCFCKP